MNAVRLTYQKQKGFVLEARFMDDKTWYEIDTSQDIHQSVKIMEQVIMAESIFKMREDGDNVL